MGKVLSDTLAEMQAKDVRGTDQFFHCLASCRASKITKNQDLILQWLQGKENFDYISNIFGLYGDGKQPHRKMLADMRNDMTANRQGLSCPVGKDCNSQCSSLLDNLPAHKRVYMYKYRTQWPTP